MVRPMFVGRQRIDSCSSCPTFKGELALCSGDSRLTVASRPLRERSCKGTEDDDWLVMTLNTELIP